MPRHKLDREAGQTVIVVVLALFVLFAVAAVVVDGAILFAQHRSVQNTADAAVLAAAAQLNADGTQCTGDDATPGTCTYKVRTTAQNYSLSNGGPGTLHACSTVDLTDTNCYMTPYKHSDGRVLVKIQRDVSPFFASLFGFSIFHPSARAAASLTTSTVGGVPVIAYAMSTSCNAITMTGTAPYAPNAGIWSNGGYQISAHNGAFSAMLVNRAKDDANLPSPTCVKLNRAANSWPPLTDVDQRATTDWPVPLPSISVPADCTNTPVPASLNVNDAWYAANGSTPGTYCATGPISFSTSGKTFDGFTFVSAAPGCSNNCITPNHDNVFTGRTLGNGRKVVFYATGTGTSTIHVSQPNAWAGDIYAPNGGISFSGGATSFDGYMQSQTIIWTGGGTSYTGEGPIVNSTTSTAAVLDE